MYRKYLRLSIVVTMKTDSANMSTIMYLYDIMMMIQYLILRKYASIVGNHLQISDKI